MITYIGGPEGAGKTALMTRFCRLHHLLGGEIWAFPGYELMNLNNRVVSKLITPDQVMSKVDELTYILLVIDEIQNFMNHHAWQNPLIDVLTYGAFAQRRKRNFAVIATGPDFNHLPPDFKGRFHVNINCRDAHWANHDIPRGEKIEFVMIDLLGVLTGRPYTWGKPKTFFPKDFFKFYDTFSLVDPKYQHIRIQIQKEKILLDAEGHIVEEPTETMADQIDSMVSEFMQVNEYPEVINKGTLQRYLKIRLGRSLSQYEFVQLGQIMGQNGFENPKGKGIFRMPPPLPVSTP